MRLIFVRRREKRLERENIKVDEGLIVVEIIECEGEISEVLMCKKILIGGEIRNRLGDFLIFNKGI